MVENVTPGWRFVHIGPEGDGITIDGITVWDTHWANMERRIIVAHAQYPNQRHSMHTYRASMTGHTLDFAAGEFSNGVWGFFVPDSAIQ